MKKNINSDKDIEKLVEMRVRKELEKQKRQETLKQITPEQKELNNEIILKASKKILKILLIVAAVVFGAGILVWIISYIISLSLVL